MENSQPGSWRRGSNGELLLKPGIDLCNQLGFAGAVLGPNRSLKSQNNYLIAPRLGIAWDPMGDGKTAVRAGFGMFYLRDAVGPLELGTEVAPFVTNVSFNRSLDTPPTGLIASGTPSRSTALNNKNPYTFQYNLTLERELFPNTKLELGYVGNGSRHLVAFSDVNPIPLSQRVTYAETQANNLRPFGTGNWGSIFQRQWSAVSNYNALQALFRTRIKAVDAQFAYTWSKTLSNTDITDSSGSSNTLNTYLDALNHHLDYGPAQINRPHMFVGNIVYNAPTLAGQNGFIRTALGSWQLSSILTYTSGPSLTVLAGDVSGSAPGGIQGTGFTSGERPNRVPGQSCRSSSGGLNWINPAAFTLDHYVLGSNPTSPRGVCLGPGNAQTDFSVAKNFKITERVTAKFSMDFFNLFNKSQFIATAMNLSLASGATLCTAANPCPGYANDTLQWNPSTDLQSDFGVNSSARDARQIQYGLRIEF